MEKYVFDIKLGSLVRDNISGIEGIADAFYVKKNGTRQYAVQPKSADGLSRPDGWMIDEQQLTIISGLKEDQELTFEIPLGSVVLDQVSGIEGTLISAVIWINGCKFYSIQPKARKGYNVRPEPIVCDMDDVVLVGSIPAKVTPPRENGGPSEKSSSFRG